MQAAKGAPSSVLYSPKASPFSQVLLTPEGVLHSQLWVTGLAKLFQGKGDQRSTNAVAGTTRAAFSTLHPYTPLGTMLLDPTTQHQGKATILPEHCARLQWRIYKAMLTGSHSPGFLVEYFKNTPAVPWAAGGWMRCHQQDTWLLLLEELALSTALLAVLALFGSRDKTSPQMVYLYWAGTAVTCKGRRLAWALFTEMLSPTTTYLKQSPDICSSRWVQKVTSGRSSSCSLLFRCSFYLLNSVTDAKDPIPKITDFTQCIILLTKN